MDINFCEPYYTCSSKFTRYIYIEKKVSLWLLCGVQHSVIMTDSETLHTIIVIILSIYFSYFLDVPVEL